MQKKKENEKGEWECEGLPTSRLSHPFCLFAVHIQKKGNASAPLFCPSLGIQNPFPPITLLTPHTKGYKIPRLLLDSGLLSVFMENSCWPDPQAEKGRILVDDVTRLNTHSVAGVFHPRNTADVRAVLKMAARNGKQVSVRGTQHSMGAHSIAEDGYVIDTKHLNQISYCTQTEHVTTGPGATWADLIKYLNRYGKSPRTMQSYATFSVGGTISVNGHGITTDDCLSESVVSFTLVKADGEEVVCSRGEGEGGELFSLVLGGYGLFGVVTEVVLTVGNNVTLDTETLQLGVDAFPQVFQRLRSADDVEIKLARMEVTNLDNISVFICRRREGTCGTVSSLPPEPRRMGTGMQIMYKWMGTALNPARYALERSTNAAIDWVASNDKNQIMYESAVPLANLYDPLYRIDDTFILQEYFVPNEKFQQWIARAKRIYKEIHLSTDVSLLNTTIRYVQRDTDTLLSYANHDGGVFSFVLYYRLRRTAEADAELRTFHEKFVALSRLLGGTFYLPYRHHYSKEDLHAVYPMVDTFIARKRHYDPEGLFENEWYRAYFKEGVHEVREQCEVTPLALPVLQEAELDRVIAGVSCRRTDSYKRLLADGAARIAFKEQFLTKIFNIENNVKLFSLISLSALCSDETDANTYSILKEKLGDKGANVVTKTYNQVMQLKAQRTELARETFSLIGKLGKVGALHDYVSIGDSGKMVKSLRSVLGMRGNCYVLHDVDEDDVPSAVERGSAHPVGSFVEIDYSADFQTFDLPDNCADLVTMNQGLHHIEPLALKRFVQSIDRILRPGGVFIVREHDACCADIIPTLDLAHSVFNAVTGVSTSNEATEVRAFRSICEWRSIVEGSTSLKDSMLYEMEQGDPTYDEMMCFTKPGVLEEAVDVHTVVPMVDESTNLPGQLGFIADLPATLFASGKALAEYLISAGLPQGKEAMKAAVLAVAGGVVPPLVAENFIARFFDPVRDVLLKLQPILNNMSPCDVDMAQQSIFPEELFFIIPVLARRVQADTASSTETYIVSLYNDFMASFSEEAPTIPVSRAFNDKTEHKMELTLLPLMQQIVAVLPDLASPEILGKIGFSRIQVAIFNPNKAAPDVAKIAKLLSTVLDGEAFDALVEALQGVKEASLYPKLQTLTSRAAECPWRDAVMAVLGSPKVQLTSAMQSRASWLGLGDIVSMYSLAQTCRAERTEAHEQSSEVVHAVRQLTAQQNRFLETAVVHSHTPQDIPCVGEVKSARYGYSTLFAHYTDVTKEVQKLHRNDTLTFQTTPFETTFRRRVLLRPLDWLCQVLWRTSPHLIVEYTTAQPVEQMLLPKVQAVRSALLRSGDTAAVHLKDGEKTWYKLNEWMQVEVAQIFGSSMDTVPWYRFPFARFLSLYADVFCKEVAVVRQRHGAVKAFMSEAFLTSAIPGVVMAWLFGQMSLMAAPLQAALGNEYDDETQFEEVVIICPLAPQWQQLDARIQHRHIVDDLYVLRVPTFKPLTKVLMKLAAVPTARLVEISNQSHVQMVVTAPQRICIEDVLKNQEGCEILFDFAYPTDGSAALPLNRVALSAAIPYLLNIMRVCEENQVCVHQVYDWW